MTANSAAAFFAAALLILFLWWPPEIYGELGDIASALLFLFLLCSAVRHPQSGSASPPRHLSPLPAALFSIFFICLSISAVMGVDAYRSAETLLRFAAVIAFAAGLSWVGDSSLIRRMESVLIALVTCLCIYGLHQYLYSLPRLLVQPELWSDVSKEELFPVLTRMAGGRIFSRFALPSAFSCVLLAALPLVHRRIRESAAVWLYALILALLTINLFIARSYAAILLFCGYWWVDAWIRHPRYHRTFLFSSVALIFLVIPVLRPESILNFSDPANPIRLRIANWSAAYSEFLSSPVLGVGPGNFALLFPAYSTGLTETRYAHGFHMTVMAESGALGILAGLGLASLFGYWLLRDSPRFGPSLILVFLYAMVDIVFEMPSLNFLFFLLLGLSAAGSPMPLKYFRPAMIGLSVSGLLFCLVLWFAHGHYEKGVQIMNGSRISRASLQTADRHFLKAAAFWPDPKVAAARGRLELALYRIFPEERRQNLKKAAAHFSEAVRKSPAAVHYRAALAETLMAIGDTPQATVQLREAARLDPRGPYAGRYTQLVLGEPSPEVH